MYSDRIAKADMSEARRQMMARRRRSLTLLTAGTVLGLLWGIAAGGALAWTVGAGVPAVARRLPDLPAQPGPARSGPAGSPGSSAHGPARPGLRRHRADRHPDRVAHRGPDRRRGRRAARDGRHHRPDRTVRRRGVRRAGHAASRLSRPVRGSGAAVGDGTPPSAGNLFLWLGAVAQSGSAPRSHRGGQGFESPQLHHCDVSGHRAQMSWVIVNTLSLLGVFSVVVGSRGWGRGGSRGGVVRWW